MAEVTFVGFKIKRIDLNNSSKKLGPLKIIHNREFDVDYTPDNTHATAELNESIYNKNNPDAVHLYFTIEGMFDLTGVEDIETKKDAHIACYEFLSSTTKEILESLLSYSGMGNVSFDKFPLDREDIDFGEESEDGKIIDFPKQ